MDVGMHDELGRGGCYLGEVVCGNILHGSLIEPMSAPGTDGSLAIGKGEESENDDKGILAC
jgi:hypothetical protein